MSFREMKKVQLDSLQVIHDFCEVNNIKYSLGCGSLLGAVRHKGYIPWDDDIDIYLLREEYVKLITKFPHELNFVSINSLERNDDWNYAYAKAYDTRTYMVETSVIDKPLGVNIDIFPLDNAPGIDSGWQLFNYKRKFLQNIYYAKFMRLDKHRNYLKLAGQIMVKVLASPYSLRQMALFLDRYSQQFNKMDTKYVFENIQGLHLKYPFEKNSMAEMVDMPFEDRVFKCMVGYDDYLKNAYGDYMKLPPIEKQVSHHFFVPYWR